MSSTSRRKRFNAPLAERLKAEAAKAQTRARPRFLARPDTWDSKLVGLFIEVYVPANAVRKGDRGKLGDIRYEAEHMDFHDAIEGKRTPEPKISFNWSAWGEQDLETVDAVAQTFRAAAELMQSIMEGVISMDLVLETYGIRNWKED